MPLLSICLVIAIAVIRPVSALELTEILWTAEQDGAWEAAGNWSTGVLPTSGDFAYLNQPVNVTSGGSNSAGELLNRANLRITGGIFDVALGTIDTFGPITVTGDARVAVSRIYVQATGSFEANGADVDVSVVEGIFSSGHFVAQSAATVSAESLDNFATLTVASGAVMSANSMINHPDALLIVQDLDSLLQIDGNLTNDGTIEISERGALNAISVDNENVIKVHADGSLRVQTLENHQSVKVQGNGATFTATSLVTNHAVLEIDAGAASNLADLLNKATVTFSASNSTGGALANEENAELSLTSSTLNLSATAVNRGQVTIDASSALNSGAYLQEGGATRLVGGTLGAAADGEVHIAGGVLSGQGLIEGDLLTSLSGIAAPGSNGDPTDSFEITGGVSLGGIFEVQLASTAAFDYLDATGDATLGGKLFVTLLEDFAPQLGDFFDIVLANAVSGAFDDLLLPALGDGLEFSTFTGSDFFRLQIIAAAPVPLPAAVWFLIPALGTLGLARRTARGVATRS